MGRYTKNEAPESDLVIDAELHYITKRLQDILQHHMLALLLAGGFGRGEGAVVKEGNRYRPVNDYDLVVVIDSWSKLPNSIKERLVDIEDEINGNVSVKQVDIAYIERWKLALPVPSLARYEMKNGHIALYSKTPIPIRCIPSRLLPLHEAVKYFRTRTAGLLIARLLLDHKIFSEPKRLELAFLEINKAFLALGDAYLIQRKSYHFSYAKRKQIFLSKIAEWEIPEPVVKTYLLAIDNKLYPDFSLLDYQVINQQWHLATQLIKEEFLRLESYRYQRSINTLVEYNHWVVSKGKTSNNRVLQFKNLYDHENTPESINNRLISMSLLEAFETKDAEELQRLAALLSSPKTNWEQVTATFLHHWHPTGIVSTLVRGIIC